MIRPCKRSALVVAIVILAGWLLSTGQAFGWSQGGHRVVANIAYDRMEPAVRSNIVKILRKHEDFKDRFAVLMNKEIPGADADDQERWIFLQASIWPDLIRNFPKYHRDPWHYVNFPYYLSDVDEKALKGSIKPNLRLTLPSPLTDEAKMTLNCIQAFKLGIREISDSHSTPREKALYYCWLLHIGGDVHQPLHSTSLVTRARFNHSEGDRGGHLPIKSVNGAANLHSYWDGLHGKQQSLKDIMDRSDKILDDTTMKAAEDAKGNLKVEDWVQESHKIAKDFVYSKQIKNAVADGEASAPAKLANIVLPANYRMTAQQIANRRVAEAGYRLAELLTQLD